MICQDLPPHHPDQVFSLVELFSHRGLLRLLKPEGLFGRREKCRQPWFLLNAAARRRVRGYSGSSTNIK